MQPRPRALVLGDALLEGGDFRRRDGNGHLALVGAADRIAIRHASPGSGRGDGLRALGLAALAQRELAPEHPGLLRILAVLLFFVLLGRPARAAGEPA